jgi:hypothetical protein
VHLIDGRGFTFIGEFPRDRLETSIGVARPWMVPHSDVRAPRKLMPALGRVREFGAMSSSHWIVQSGAGSALQLAMSAVPWKPVVGGGAVEAAQ